MLTKKDLLKFKIQKNKLIPCFINPKNSEVIELSEACCEIFSLSIGKTKKQLEIECEEILSAFDIDIKVINGFVKLCFDSCTIEGELSHDAQNFRKLVFEKSFLNMEHNAEKRTEQILNSLNENLNEDNKFTKEKLDCLLYNDLPEFHKVTKNKNITSSQLLNKYNVSLVQGLLFHSTNVLIEFKSISKARAQFRQLLKQAKFFQLVVYFKKMDDSIVLEIDGPLSLFTQSQKYGLNLACFFPALLFMPEWKLTANIELGKGSRQQGDLILTHEENLISHYKGYSAFIPQEFSLFYNSFINQNKSLWSLSEDCDDILFDGENTFFPDFLFTYQNGLKVYCELFHPWHSRTIIGRLNCLAKFKPSFIILLGISKDLLKNAEYSAQINLYPELSLKTFVFKEVISPQKIFELLKAVEVTL